MTTNWQQPPGEPPPAQPNNQNNQNKGKRLAVIALLLLLIAGLTAGAGLFMANRDSDTVADNARYVLTETVATKPVFEARDARGPDPFFPLEVQLVAFQGEREADVRDEAELLLQGAEPGQEVEVPAFNVAALDEAVKTGLYGGTEENTCDPERLISFLYANPDLGEAWAKVQAIEFVDIADYIRSLEVRILAEPTNVLNHGFNPDSGAPYEIDAILDAGTAVLVDSKGDVRTRCYCGNPIKPKPPEHMPPRCVVWIENVYVEPAGVERRENAVRDVLLTGRETTVGGAVWIEVKWGTDDHERGWVRSDNLRKHYCPPEQIEWQCPGPDDVAVWADPDTTDQVGWHTGTLHTTTASSTDIFGPVQPVGGPNPTIVNDFMLVRFKQAAPSVQNSAWVRTKDLAQDDENCFRIPQCVNTEGPVWARAGGAIHSAGGVMRVEFTGRFVTDFVTHAEVRLLEEGGIPGWIGNFYTPLDDADCDDRVIYECVTDPGKGGASVFENSTGFDHIGHIYNAEVTITGSAQDGRVPVDMATTGGPSGWIDESLFTADLARCVPDFACYTTTAPAFAEFATNGAAIGAQGASIIGVVGKLAHGVIPDLNDYVRIEVGGSRYWIPDFQLLPVLGVSKDCNTDVECPTYGWGDGGRQDAPRIEELTELRLSGELEGLQVIDDGERRPERPTITECCVTALYATPDTSTPVLFQSYPVQVTVEGFVTVDNGGGDEIWFFTDTGDFFMDIHVAPLGDCSPACPQPKMVQVLSDGLDKDLPQGLLTRIEEPRAYYPEPGVDADCCISGAFTGIFSGVEAPGPWPREVDVVSGPHAPAPGWYMTADGDWFRTSQVLPNSACEMIECPNPMIPRLYDKGDLLRDTEETIALASLYLGDTAECCADGEIFSGPGFDQAIGAPLTEPTSVVVVNIDGEWYQVIIQDFVAWIHVSQFVDLGDCDDVPCNSLQSAIDSLGQDVQILVDCCISQRVRTVNPAEAGPGDWVTIDPAADGRFVDITEHDGETWYAFDTDGYGTVWARVDNIVNGSACDRDVECPGDSLVGTAIADDFENGISTSIYSCCVTFNSANGGQMFKVVTLTGETMTTAGVTSYEATDGEWYIETDFANAGRCSEQVCPDGQTVVQTLADCPPSRTTTPGFTCDDGSVVQTPSQCPPPPPTCTDSDQDSICDSEDNCDFVPNPNQNDFDRDGLGDLCDECPEGDFDGDGICDNQDNCPETRNPNQNNNDGDGVGDACDNCPFQINGFQVDRDGDGIGDACEEPDCPKDRVLANGQCCPTGSTADGSQCFCQGGPEVRPGDTCPPPCPDERQIPGSICCPAGTTAGSVDCFCPDQSVAVPGQPCAALGEPVSCTKDRLRGDGICCPEGTVAFSITGLSAIIWRCATSNG